MSQIKSSWQTEASLIKTSLSLLIVGAFSLAVSGSSATLASMIVSYIVIILNVTKHDNDSNRRSLILALHDLIQSSPFYGHFPDAERTSSSPSESRADDERYSIIYIRVFRTPAMMVSFPNCAPLSKP